MFNSSKRTVFASSLLAFAVLAAGGCGTSGNSGAVNPSKPDVPEKHYSQISNKVNEKGVPEIFALPEAKTNLCVSKKGDKPDKNFKTASEVSFLEKEEAGEHNWGKVEVPAQVRSVLLAPETKQFVDDKDNSEYEVVYNDSDAFRAELSKGVKYTVEISKNLTAPLSGFVPSCSISRIEKNTEANNEKDSEQDSKDSEVKIPVDNKDIVFTAEPKEDPYVVALTFTPEKDGVYEIKIADADQQTDSESTTDYLFRIYEEQGTDGNYGHPVLYGFSSEDDGDNLTLDEVVSLRRSLATADACGVDDQGNSVDASGNVLVDPHSECLHEFPVIIGEADQCSAHEAFDSKLKDIQEKHQLGRSIDSAALKADDKTTELAPKVAGVNWEDNMAPGDGYFSNTGIQASYKALKPFELKNEVKEPEVNFNSHFVSNKEDHEKEMNVNVSATYSGAAASVKAATDVSKSIKYSLTSTTLVMHYSKTDKQYQTADKYEFTDKAAELIADKDYEGFREKYGDYFVGGVKMGASIDAYIAVTTKSTEDLNKVKASIEGKAFDVTVGSEYSQSVKNALNNQQVSILIRHSGDMPATDKVSSGNDKFFYMAEDGSFKPLTGEAAAKFSNDEGKLDLPKVDATPQGIDAVLDEIRQFKENTNKEGFKFTSVQALMMRYTFAEGGDDIPKDISVDPDVYVASREFCRNMLGLTSYYNAVKSIPASNLKDYNTLNKEWDDEYSQVMEGISSRLSKICSSADSIKDENKKVVELSDKFRILSERWTFYSMLMQQQAGSKSDKFVNIGMISFPLSSEVCKDYGKMKSDSYSKSWHVGWRDWTPDWTADDGCVWAYIHTRHDSNGNVTCDDKAYPSLGNRHLKYFIESGYDRGLKAWCDAVPVNLKNYPFYGLKNN